MSRVVTNPSPKARFLDAPLHITKHRDMLQLPEFDRAITFALLEFQAILSKGPLDFNTCAASHLRIQGAQEFIGILRNLAEAPTTLAVERRDGNLDHKA